MSGEGAEPDARPRRLHPATVLVAIIRGAPSTLLGLPAVLAAASRMNLPLVLSATAAAFALAVLLRWLDWRRFTYLLAPDAVVIESGVLSRNRRTIPYERIADVGIERRPLQRLFGLAAVTLESGGAGADEGRLDSVSVAEAGRLREALRRLTAAATDAAAPAAAGDAAPVTRPAAAPVFAMDRRRVGLSGLFNFSLVWIAVAGGALQYADRALGLDEDALWRAVAARTGMLRSAPLVAWAGAAAAGIALVLAVGVIAGLVRTALRDHGFRLLDEGGRLRRTRGLFTRSEAIVALPRIQLATIDTGPVRRRFGWSRLRAQVLGGEGEGGRQDLAPFARAHEVDRILGLLRLERHDPAELTPVSRGHLWRALPRSVGLPALLIAGAAFATPAALLASPLLIPFAAAALLGRRRHRYRLADGLLQVQRGVVGRTTWIVPARHVQTVTLRRGWLQRRLGLATVLVDTAGGGRTDGPNVHDLREGDAWALVAALGARDRRQADAVG